MNCPIKVNYHLLTTNQNFLIRLISYPHSVKTIMQYKNLTLMCLKSSEENKKYLLPKITKLSIKPLQTINSLSVQGEN